MDREHRSIGRVFSSEDGAMAVLVAVIIVALLAFAAIVVDAGALYSQRRQMQTAADAAALAGVQELPGDPGGAISTADVYALENLADADDRTFSVEQQFVPNDKLVVELRQTAMGLFFANFMGRETAPVTASAVAVIGSPRTYGSGLMPFGIMALGTTQSPFGYEAGEWIELKRDDGDQGNWSYVDLKGFTDGANNTKSVISNGGTTDPVSIGDIIYTQTGEPDKPNFDALNGYFTCDPHGLDALVYNQETGVYEPTHESNGTHCYRMITCPVIIMTAGDPYDWDSAKGKSIPTQVVGFLNMLVDNDPDWKEGILLAQFVQVVPVGALNPGGYIPYGGIVYWLDQ